MKQFNMWANFVDEIFIFVILVENCCKTNKE